MEWNSQIFAVNLNMPSENSEGCLPLSVYRDMRLEQKLERKRSLGLFLAKDIPGCVILPLSSSFWSPTSHAFVVRIHLRNSGQKGIWLTLLIRPLLSWLSQATEMRNHSLASYNMTKASRIAVKVLIRASLTTQTESVFSATRVVNTMCGTTWFPLGRNQKGSYFPHFL